MKAMTRPRIKCQLIPINLHDEAEFEELRHQRIVCGWNSDIPILEGWRKATTQKTKSMFWITIPSTDDSSRSSSNEDSTLPSPSFQKAGHISLDSISEPPDPSLASPDKSILTISTFFIYPSHRGDGLGRTAMSLLESYATKEPYGSPNCKVIAINTLDKRYYEDDEWRTMWQRLEGREPPMRGSSNEAWYERMGYVKWKSEGRYEQRMESGEVVKLVASFLRKKVC